MKSSLEIISYRKKISSFRKISKKLLNSILINNLFFKIFNHIMNKTLPIRRKNYIYLMKLYKYKYRYIKLHILFNALINNSHGIIISCCQDSKKITNISLNFSRSVFKNVNAMRRTKYCLDYWIPFIVKYSKHENKKFAALIDSSDEGYADYLNMDSEHKNKLIPDLYSMITNNEIDKNFIPLDFESFKNKWLQKKNIVLWRGGTTGGYYSNFQDLNSLQRIQICKKYHNVNGLDIKITRIVQNGISKKEVKNWLIHHNIYSKEIKEERFESYKYYPDIPGNALAWGTIRKYLIGNLIFKPYTKRKLFYYQFMEPWKDYIPVDENFFDLNEKYEWAEKNQEETAYIAWNGYLKAHDYIKRIPEHFISVLLQNKYKG